MFSYVCRFCVTSFTCCCHRASSKSKSKPVNKPQPRLCMKICIIACGQPIPPKSWYISGYSCLCAESQGYASIGDVHWKRKKYEETLNLDFFAATCQLHFSCSGSHNCTYFRTILSRGRRSFAYPLESSDGQTNTVTRVKDKARKWCQQRL